jgi:hypothetical protein
MALSTPKHIRDANVDDQVVKFIWDDWDLIRIFESGDDEFHKRMAQISYRGNIAFTIATGEWIVHRFDSVSEDPIPLEHMEAAWAALVDPWYAIWWQPPDEEWLGPIRGPLSLAIIFTLQARAYADEGGDVAGNSFKANNVAEHVLTVSDPFREWRERVVNRLELLYPFNEHDPLGEVVPREALNPDFEFRPELTERLVNHYLRNLEPRKNQFLRTAQEMLECGFKGVPYSFDMAEDRVTRCDW